jgi:general secretion pathway protein K
MNRSHRAPWRERGAALLIAMLTVALVATFASAALWQQWRSIEVESAERARVQSDWILTGALDWARLLLREDAMAGGADHLGEPWAVPLQEARLSSFLAADHNVSTDTGPDVLDAFLSGQITDMHSLLNVNNLVAPDGKVSADGVESFARLFEVLGLPQDQLDTLVENLRLAREGASSNSPSAMAPLLPQWVDQLAWLGLTPQTLTVLRPYITILPGDPTQVNLNTASAEVIYAAVPGLAMAEAKQLVAARERSYFRTLGDAAALLSGGVARLPQGQGTDVRSRYFEVRSRLRLDRLIVEERALLDRQSPQRIRVVQRERSTPEAAAQTTATR